MICLFCGNDHAKPAVLKDQVFNFCKNCKELKEEMGDDKFYEFFKTLIDKFIERQMIF